MTDPSAALYGRAWVRHPPPKEKRKPTDGPPASGARAAAIEESLKPEARARIKAEAREAAARILADFDRRTAR